MSRVITTVLSNETHHQLTELARAHHGGSVAAAARWVIDEGIMPQDYYPTRERLEGHMAAKDAEGKQETP